MADVSLMCGEGDEITALWDSYFFLFGSAGMTCYEHDPPPSATATKQYEELGSNVLVWEGRGKASTILKNPPLFHQPPSPTSPSSQRSEQGYFSEPGSPLILLFP